MLVSPTPDKRQVVGCLHGDNFSVNANTRCPTSWRFGRDGPGRRTRQLSCELTSATDPELVFSKVHPCGLVLSLSRVVVLDTRRKCRPRHRGCWDGMCLRRADVRSCWAQAVNSREEFGTSKQPKQECARTKSVPHDSRCALVHCGVVRRNGVRKWCNDARLFFQERHR